MGSADRRVRGHGDTQVDPTTNAFIQKQTVAYYACSGRPTRATWSSSTAVEALQRVPDRAALFNECHRVLAHGGMIRTETPSTDGRGAFQDPSHVSFWNENSFWYLTQSRLRPSIPELTARFQVSHLGTSFPSDWHREVNISYVFANLLAVKDGPRQGGPLLS